MRLNAANYWRGNLEVEDFKGAALNAGLHIRSKDALRVSRKT